MSALAVTRGVAWRVLHNVFTNPSLLIPSLVFPLFFVLFFLSSMNMPRDLIEVDWFRTVATYNPVSYLVEGVRSLIITWWDAEALALIFGIVVLFVLVDVCV